MGRRNKAQYHIFWYKADKDNQSPVNKLVDPVACFKEDSDGTLYSMSSLGRYKVSFKLSTFIEVLKVYGNIHEILTRDQAVEALRASGDLSYKGVLMESN